MHLSLSHLNPDGHLHPSRPVPVQGIKLRYIVYLDYFYTFDRLLYLALNIATFSAETGLRSLKYLFLLSGGKHISIKQDHFDGHSESSSHSISQVSGFPYGTIHIIKKSHLRKNITLQ